MAEIYTYLSLRNPNFVQVTLIIVTYQNDCLKFLVHLPDGNLHVLVIDISDMGFLGPDAVDDCVSGYDGPQVVVLDKRFLHWGLVLKRKAPYENHKNLVK